MPELPEVRTVTKALDKMVAGKVISNVTVNKEKMVKEITPSAFKNKLIKQTVISVTNKGKFIVFHLSNNLVLVSHLRMEGKYHSEEWANKKHDHVIFEFKDGTKLFYNDTRQFGTFHLRTEADFLQLPPLSKMGPEPSEVNIKELFDKMNKKRLPIKATLLDQSILSGLGNIYVDEVLWTAKVHPQTASNQISQDMLVKIIEAAKDILERATKAGGTTIRSYTSIEKTEGGFQDFLNVHTKVNMPCPRCQTKIVKIKVGGRGTYICPKEQKIA